MFNRVPHTEDVKDSGSIALRIHNLNTRRGAQLHAFSSVVLAQRFPSAYWIGGWMGPNVVTAY